MLCILDGKKEAAVRTKSKIFAVFLGLWNIFSVHP